MNQHRFKNYLLAGTVICSAAIAAAPAYAQDQVQTAPVTTVSAEDVEEAEGESIVITGSMFRRTNTETPSPVTTLTAESLAEKGITTVSDAVRSIAADNSGSIPTSFTAGFGAGGAGVSLRGLTVNSTVTLVDGLRIANYPLADDGQRSFVDLNTLPMVAVERIEVLKDGASSTYGADAIGGVVNVIMRKAFQGVEGNIEWGTSGHSDGDTMRASVLAGFGDYEGNGANIYFGAEYEKHDTIWNRDRGFPYNTLDLSSLPGGNDGDWNTASNGASTSATTVRPANQLDLNNPLSGVAISGGLYQVLTSSQCTNYEGRIVTTSAGHVVCEQNQIALLSRIQPETERWGVTARAAVRVNDDIEGYLMGSFYRSFLHTSSVGGTWPNVRVGSPIRTTGMVLPARLSNGALNPNNPFAASGQAALLYHRFTEANGFTERQSDVVRAAAGISGSFGEGWTFAVDTTAVTNRLTNTFNDVIFLPSLIEALKSGSYNFRDRAAPGNAAALASILRPLKGQATTSLYMAQAFVTKELTQLPGGPLQLGVGAQVRLEDTNQPDINPAKEWLGTNQYHAFGSHTVTAGFFEISAPIVDQLELLASGRYDSYSEGFSAFSPKVGFKFTPIREIALRGTYSRGFRAPGIPETGDAGVIGFIGYTPPCSLRIQHGATGNSTACSGGNAYVTAPGLGFNSTGNPDLKPEKSESFTLGAVVQPVRWLSFTVDYYNIKVKDLISQGPLASVALDAYYAGTALPPGYSMTLNPADPDFPAAQRTVYTVNSPYANAASLSTDGLDVSILVQAKLADQVRVSSQLEVSTIFDYAYQSAAGQPVQHYVGTQGPYILSSGAGTPKWRGNWSNTIEYGPASLTATASYVSGTHTWADDITLGEHNCEVGADALYSKEFCHTKSFVNVDLVGSYDVTDNINVYFNVFNLFDAKAPINPANYAAINYNPTWHQAGAVGRFFKLGARFKF
jgi:iron complex outermembrane receptor protein